MRLFLTSAFFAAALSVSGQQFVEMQSIALADTITSATPSSIDLDNDGLPDLALLVRTVSGKSYLMHVPGDTLQPLAPASSRIELPAFKSYAWYDYNNDNALDLVLSPDDGEQAQVFINQGDFAFVPTTVEIPDFETILFADLDADGKNECVVSGSQRDPYSTQTLRAGSTSGWTVEHDTLKVRLSSIVSADFNNDGFRDLYISGREKETDSVFCRILLYESGRFVKAAEKNLEAKPTVADVNHDGFMDVFSFGKTKKGNPGQFIFYGGSDIIKVVDLSDGKNFLQSFRADFNSDGRVDELALTATSTDTLNILKIDGGSSDALTHKQLVHQIVTDFEHDGDLDLVQVTRGSYYSLRYLKNAVENPNLAPQGPKHGIGFPIYNHLFFYWEKALDDHTPANSISYDFYLESPDENSPCEFDLLNGKRLSFNHGNNALSNYKLIRDFSSSGFRYAIQSVDNALHAGPGGVCIGSGSACVTIGEEVTAICAEERLKLQAPSAAHWFSLANGHLGDGAFLDVPMAKDDTVFYIVPDYQGCIEVRIFPVKVGELAIVSNESMTVCESAIVDLAVPGDWTGVSWRSESSGQLGSGSSIKITAMNDDTIVVSYAKSASCTYERKYQIRVSKPVLHVQPSSAKIAPGGTVTLSVTGANSFQWSPSETLSNAQGSSTVASPLVTTKYAVTGYDSINCQATAEVTVFVETGAGFVPSLFTPNADGTNDELRVYGLNDVNDFTWKIYNREGNVVFSTRSISEATGRGWDGTANGVRQPNGVYFWKVEGSRRNGELLLNGKKEGSFLLIR